MMKINYLNVNKLDTCLFSNIREQAGFYLNCGSEDEERCFAEPYNVTYLFAYKCAKPFCVGSIF